jgi:methionyl-tRNA synthetase
MDDFFYITTPIYYVNDEPHIGHAYTTILADVLARFARLRGRPTFFLTGVDEHGQKVQNAARKLDLDPQTYVDEMAQRWQATWKRLNISYDDFIRTTQPRHVQVVEHVLQDLWQRGEIYRGEYEGWYCVADERFWTEKDLVSGLCPECGRPVERIVEANYFFRMSAYQEWLVEYIHAHPDFIRPEWRRNEVLGFLRQPLGDLCISRPASRLSWGIPLPFDPAYVTYVWFDALLNYVTAAGYLNESPLPQADFETVWPNAIHLVGKDILTTHSVYWPTMLKASALRQPKCIFAHGWWVLEGAKISKSRGGTVKPLELADVYGVDALRYFLLRDMTLGQDAEFSRERLDSRYHTDLANNLGNLLQRLSQLVARRGGTIPQPDGETALEQQLRTQCTALPQQVFDLAEDFAVNQALEKVFDTLTAVNQYLETTAPWKMSNAKDPARLGTILYTACEALRLCSVLLSPVIPEKAAEIWQRLGWQPSTPLAEGLTWGGLQPGVIISVGERLFPRKENIHLRDTEKTEKKV